MVRFKQHFFYYRKNTNEIFFFKHHFTSNFFKLLGILIEISSLAVRNSFRIFDRLPSARSLFVSPLTPSPELKIRLELSLVVRFVIFPFFSSHFGESLVAFC